jgi:NADPH-dependent ferric siderophore reductase
MPNVPKWVADQMENILSSKFMQVEVAAVINYSAEIKKITFKADLSRVDFYAGSAINFRAGDTEIRHYTPSAFDSAAGTFEVLFHVHGNGPGSNLAGRLRPGDRLKVSVPGGRRLYDKDKAFHFFFGDETSLSFYDAVRREVIKNNQWPMGIFELNEINRHVPEDLGYDVKTVLRTPENPAREAVTLLDGYVNTIPGLFKDTAFYLTGNVASVQKFRAVLKKHGISSKNIKLQGYWAEGSVGL